MNLNDRHKNQLEISRLQISAWVGKSQLNWDTNNKNLKKEKKKIEIEVLNYLHAHIMEAAASCSTSSTCWGDLR